jgi:hypothetical protein
MNNSKNPTYQLRFFFDYGCGGCLWSDNEAAYERYGAGTLDAEILDVTGNVYQQARITLPAATKQKVLELDKLYNESLDWGDPAGPSKWNELQWDNFYSQTKALHKEIESILGPQFDVIYKQA